MKIGFLPKVCAAKVVAAAVVAMLAMCAPAIDVASGPAVPGVWSGDFAGALAKAKADKHPLLVICSNKGCAFCNRLARALDSAFFKAWMANRKPLMVYLLEGQPQFNEALKFIKDGFPDVTLVPFVSMYRLQPDGQEIKRSFSGRRRSMLVQGEKLMQTEFAKSLDLIIEDYLNTRSDIKSIEELVKSTEKIFRVQSDGSGKVHIMPSDGMLREGDSPAFLTATADGDGVAFAYWIAPGGEVAGYSSKLEVPYPREAGTYKAKFVKIADCQPPAIDLPSTSVCTRAGGKFSFAVRMDDAMRPVSFAAKGLPFGLSINKETGVISGITRRPGTYQVKVTAASVNTGLSPTEGTLSLTVIPKERRR